MASISSDIVYLSCSHRVLDGGVMKCVGSTSFREWGFNAIMFDYVYLRFLFCPSRSQIWQHWFKWICQWSGTVDFQPFCFVSSSTISQSALLYALCAQIRSDMFSCFFLNTFMFSALVNFTHLSFVLHCALQKPSPSTDENTPDQSSKRVCDLLLLQVQTPLCCIFLAPTWLTAGMLLRSQATTPSS
jgi:hypothetical protein